MAMASLTEALSPKDFDPIERSFKWILILGRFLGVIPVSISWKVPQLSISFRWWSFSAMHSFFLTFILLLVLVPQILGLPQDLGRCKHILDQLMVMDMPSFLLTYVFIFVFFLKNGKTLVILMDEWKETMSLLNLPKKDHNFFIFCLSIVAVILGVGMIENIFSDFSMIESQVDLEEGLPFLEKVYLVEVKRFADWVPYNPILSILFLYALRVGINGWNYADILLIALCRTVTLKFHEINEEILQHLKCFTDFPLNQVVIDPFKKSVGESILNPKIKDLGQVAEVISSPGNHHLHHFQVPYFPSISEHIKFWKDIRFKIMILCEVANHITKFVAPLVLACYGCNIVFIISRILQFLYDSSTIVENSVYILTSTFQFFLRVLLVTYYTSQVYHSTEDIVRTIELSTDSYISDTAFRLERMLGRHPIGVTILGAVTITRKFFISIISFMFTTEIILLQAMSTGGNAES